MVVPSASFKVMMFRDILQWRHCALHNIFTGNRELTVIINVDLM